MGLLTNLFGREKKEDELDSELQSFLEFAEARHRERGASPEEAYRAARLELGGAEQVKETVRDAWAGALLDSLWRDVRYGVRALRRNPGFTLVVVLTLALGIGANTAIFSLVHGVLLAPLGYDDPDRLALVWFRYDAAGQTRNPGSGPELLDLRERSRRFKSFAGIWSTTGSLTGEGDPEQVRVGLVTANFFEVLGAQPAIGRAFVPEEEGAEGAGAILLSDGLWQRRYAADPNILGNTVQYDGHAVTVVGILPPGFTLRFPADSSVPSDIEAFLPFPWTNRTLARDLAFIRVLGRLQPDITLAQARDEVRGIAAQLRGEFARYQEIELGLDVVPLQADVVKEIRPALLALMGGVVLVLLIACVNVANLQLSRFAARRQEIALRSALGAGQWRIVRQLLVESLLLALMGGAAGIAVAGAGLRLLGALRPQGLDQLASVELSAPVLAFTLGLSVLTGVLFGLAPVIESCRIGLMDVLRRGGPGSAPARERLRSLLVTAQFALGFLLLIGAGLMIRTLIYTLDASPGFRPAGALTFQVSMPRARYDDDTARALFTGRFIEEIEGLPGVESVGAVSHLPLDDYPNWYGFAWRDGATAEEKNSVLADQRAITPGYLQALGAELVEGRFFEASDHGETQPVLIIDENLAQRLWPGESALEHGLHMEAYQNGDFVARRAVVVGVVKHVQQHSLTADVRGQSYFPHPQSARPVMTYVVRTEGDPALMARPIAARLQALDADLPMANVRPLEEVVQRASAGPRFTTFLAGVFAGTALLLAAIGLYGTLAYSVQQRSHEIGVRMALGAGSRQVLRLVIGRGLRSALLGLGLGAIGAMWLGRFLAGQLYGVAHTDGLTYGAVALLLLIVALLGSWIPARRATRVDPLLCLRCE